MYRKQTFFVIVGYATLGDQNRTCYLMSKQTLWFCTVAYGRSVWEGDLPWSGWVKRRRSHGHPTASRCRLRRDG